MSVEILDNGTRVLTAPGATFGTDALLLARFAQPRRNERALDLCSGCGIVSLVWHDAGHRGPCTALEIDPAASALCAAALAENADAAHIAPVCGDLRQLCTAGPEQGQYDFAACNPPDFTAGPRSPRPAPGRGPPHRQLHPPPTPWTARAAPCGTAGGSCSASARSSWREILAAFARRATLSRSVWLLSRTAPTPRPGFSSSKPRRAAKPACASSRTF